jgi:quercetin dioxygenase-like cupin family protein
MTGMTRLAAGSSIPAHRHTHADQTVFVVEGDLIDDGVSYGPGSFFVVKGGSPHGPHGTSGGCVLLTTYSGRPDFRSRRVSGWSAAFRSEAVWNSTTSIFTIAA